MQLIVDREGSPFRQYASSSDDEFFAVAIGNVFERPMEFNDFHPQMYTSLAMLLNQARWMVCSRKLENNNYTSDDLRVMFVPVAGGYRHGLTKKGD